MEVRSVRKLSYGIEIYVVAKISLLRLNVGMFQTLFLLQLLGILPQALFVKMATAGLDEP